MIQNYLQVLEESLHKKLDVLQRIEALSCRQEQILKEFPVDEEEFDFSIDEKGELIEELNKLDDGFEALYENVRHQLLEGKERYSDQIQRLQELIGRVTDKSVAVQAQEARNNQLAENFFRQSRQELRKGRRSSKAALDYYYSMNHSRSISPQFMDKKK